MIPYGSSKKMGSVLGALALAFVALSCKDKVSVEPASKLSNLVNSSSTFVGRYFNILLIGTNEGNADVNLVLTLDRSKSNNNFIFTLNRDVGKSESNPNCPKKILAETYPHFGLDKAKYATCIEDMMTKRISNNPSNQLLPQGILAGGRFRIESVIEVKLESFATLISTMFRSILGGVGDKAKIAATHGKGLYEYMCGVRSFLEFMVGKGKADNFCKFSFSNIINIKKNIEEANQAANAKMSRLLNCVQFKVRARGKYCKHTEKKLLTPDCRSQHIDLHDSCEGYVRDQIKGQKQLPYASGFQRDFYAAKFVTEALGYLAKLRKQNLPLFSFIVKPIYETLGRTLASFEHMDAIVGDSLSTSAFVNGYSSVAIVMWDGTVDESPGKPSNRNINDKTLKNFIYFKNGVKKIEPKDNEANFSYLSLQYVYMPATDMNFVGLRDNDKAYGHPPWVVPEPPNCPECLNHKMADSHVILSSVKEIPLNAVASTPPVLASAASEQQAVEAKEEAPEKVETFQYEEPIGPTQAAKRHKLVITGLNRTSCSVSANKNQTVSWVENGDGCVHDATTYKHPTCPSMYVRNLEIKEKKYPVYRSRYAEYRYPYDDLEDGAIVNRVKSCKVDGRVRVLVCVTGGLIASSYPEHQGKTPALQGNQVWVNRRNLVEAAENCF